MADLQDIIKQIEEERKKAAEAELKQKQDARDQQEKDAKILSAEQKGLVQEKIKQQKEEQKAQAELSKKQEQFNKWKERFNNADTELIKNALKSDLETAQKNLETAQNAHKVESDLLNNKLTALKDNADVVREAIAQQKAHNLAEKQKADELAKKKIEAQESNIQKEDELAAKYEKLEKIKNAQLKGWENLAVGANKAITGIGESIKERFAETSIGKITGFLGMHKIGKDDTLEKEQKAVIEEQKVRAEAKSKGKVLSDEDVQKKVAERTAEPEKVSKLVSSIPILKGWLASGLEQQKELVKAEAIDPSKKEEESTEETTTDTPQLVAQPAEKTTNTPIKAEIVAQPTPEKDKFAEEKAKESAHAQEEQAETQERMADALEQQQEGDQNVKVEGKDTGIFGKILSGKFNPLKALQGMVSGIFGIIEEFIKGIGNILKSALEVVQKLVKGVGDILLTIVDIIGKGFVKLMTFAGQGIAALFKALGSIPPQALLIGAAAIGVLTLAFMGLGKGLQMMTPAIKELATIPFDNFLSLAGGLLVLTPALIAFGVGAAIATPGFLGLALGVGALGLAMKLLAPAIETIVPPITDLLGSFGDFLSTLQGIVSKFFTSIGDFIATVGTAISDFISNFAQSLVIMNDADFVHIAAGFVALGVALAGFGVAAAIAIPSLLALGSASSGLADLINVPPDRFDALRESFKLLGKAVKGFAKDAKGLGGAVVAMGALSMIPFANKLLKVQSEKTETRDVIDNFKGGVAEAIQPVDIVSFSGARTERGVEMLRQAAETVEIRDETAMNASGANVVTTAVTDASSVTNNAIVMQDSPTDSGFRASASTY